MAPDENNDLLDSLHIDPEKKAKLKDLRDRYLNETGIDPTNTIYGLMQKESVRLEDLQQLIEKFYRNDNSSDESVRLVERSKWHDRSVRIPKSTLRYRRKRLSILGNFRRISLNILISVGAKKGLRWGL